MSLHKAANLQFNKTAGKSATAIIEIASLKGYTSNEKTRQNSFNHGSDLVVTRNIVLMAVMMAQVEN